MRPAGAPWGNEEEEDWGLSPEYDPDAPVEDVGEFNDEFGIAPSTPVALKSARYEEDPEPHVAPEFKVSNVLKRQDEMKAAQREDRKRQDSDDIRMLLLAAGTRSKPQLRNLGTPEMSALLKQYQMQPKAVDPLEQERKLLELQKLRDGLKAKPVDPRDSQLKDLLIQMRQKDVNAEPKPSGKPPLTPERRAYWEGIAGKALPPDATEDDVKTLGGFVKSENSLKQSANQFGTRLAEDRGKEARGEEKAQAGMEIPGWKRDPSVRVDDAEVRQLRDAAGETKSLEDSINKLEAAIQKHGIELNPRSPGYAEIGSLMSDVKLKMKGPAAYALGVLAGPDMAILDSLTGDPTSLRGAFRGTDDALTRLRTARQSAKERLGAKMGSRGYGNGGQKPKTKAVWNGTAWEVDDG